MSTRRHKHTTRRPHKARREPGRCALNAWEIAINGARRLSRQDVGGYLKLLRRAALEFPQGIQCAEHWRTLADAANMTETLSAMGIARGEDATRVVEAANDALKAVTLRHQQRGTWTLYAAEVDALAWLVRLHETQLQACSYSEFVTAFDRTAQRVAQAIAGNASPGTIVIDGGLA